MKQYTNKKSYLSWFVSYLIFMALFLISISIITELAKANLKNEIIKANRASFDTIQSNIQSMKIDMDKFAVNLALDESVIRFVQKKGTNNAQDYYSLYQLKNTFQDYWKTYDYIEEICIFNQNTESMLINGGIVQALNSYNDYTIVQRDGSVQDYEAWKNFLKQKHTQELYRTDSGNLVYIQSIPYDQNNHPMGTMILTISKWKLDNMLREKSMRDNKVFMIFNHNNEAVFCSNNHPVVDFLQNREEGFAKREETISLEGSKMELFSSEKESNLICAFAIEEKVFWDSLNKLYRIILLISLLLFVIGLILAVKFTQKHYTPVAALMKLVSGQKRFHAVKSNEYEYIQNYLLEMLKTVKETEKLRKRYQSESFNSELIKLLNEPDTDGSVQELFQRFQIDFSYPYYIAAVVSVIDISGYFEEVDVNDQQEKELVQIAISNVLNEMLGEDYHLLTIYLNQNMMLCMIGCEQEICVNQTLRCAFEKAQRLVKEKVGIYYNSAVSDPFRKLAGIPNAYTQAVDTHAYQKSINADSLFYCDVNWNKQRYEFTLDMERQMIDFLKQADIASIKVQIEQLCSMDTAQSDITQRLTWLKYDISGAFLKMIRRSKGENDPQVVRQLSQIERSGDLEQFKKAVFAMAEMLCEKYGQNPDLESSRTLGEKIMEYVNQNYGNFDLNVNMLGTVFDLSPNHMSKTFKNQTGEILRDYIMRVRLKHAEMFLAADLKIDEVAEKCGFADAGSFIRAFKKHFGTTPGKYREGLK